MDHFQITVASDWSINTTMHLLAPGGSVFIILARSSAMADQTGATLCSLNAEPKYQRYSEPLCCISSEVTPKIYTFTLFKVGGNL